MRVRKLTNPSENDVSESPTRSRMPTSGPWVTVAMKVGLSVGKPGADSHLGKSSPIGSLSRGAKGVNTDRKTATISAVNRLGQWQSHKVAGDFLIDGTPHPPILAAPWTGRRG